MTKPFDLIFLEGEMPLTKTYELVNGEIIKTPYPSAYFFTSHHEPVENLKDFAHHLKIHAAAGHCILKGQVHRPLLHESRANSTSPLDPTHWVCLDFDGLPGKHSIDALLVMLGLGGISYVLQWSASYRIPLNNDAVRCHVFMLLDKPSTPSALRQWLIGLNLNTAFLRENTALTNAKVTLRWGLDVTACQNDKLLYIAEPVLIGLPNPFTKGKNRISIVTKARPYLQLNNVPASSINKAMQQQRVDELRTLESLPPKKVTYKTVENASQQVVSNPETVDVYEVKEERGWVYFNFNGGDSWGYYHHANNADVIYNFKGEDPVLTSKLLPDYYGQAKKKAKSIAKEEAAEINTGVHQTDKLMLAFQDRHGVYWVGSYDEATDNLDIYKKKSEKQVRDFCAQFAIPMGEFIPQWNTVFNPQSEVRVDLETRTINSYQPSKYMAAPMKKVNAPPPITLKLIHHALGSEPEITDHFINWLAFIVQTREHTGTAWLFYGTEGTGKGLMFNHVLRPLLGEAQTTMARVEDMLKGFNGFVKNKLLVAFDEVHIGAMKEQEEILGRLRNMISESHIQIRDLYASPDPTPNFTNYLFFSNKRDAVMINTTDRRYNVGKYQHIKLEERHPEFRTNRQNTVRLLEAELQSFAYYLRAYPVNPDAARTPLDTADRDSLIATTINSADQIASYISFDKASMQGLIDQLPSDERKVPHVKREAMRDYKQVLVDNMLRTIERINHPRRDNASNTNGAMSRDEAMLVFEYCVGNIKCTPTKFHQYLRHRHLDPVKVWIDGKSTSGLKVHWQDVDKFPEYLKALGYKEKA